LGSMDDEGGEDTPCSAGGGYRAKKRESRGGSDSASFMYCREVMIVRGWCRNASIIEVNRGLDLWWKLKFDISAD
jgi:hypothetical protein